MAQTGINAFVEALFERIDLEVYTEDGGKVVIKDGEGNVLGMGRNLPLAIRACEARAFMKYGQVLGLAMAYAFGPEGVVAAVFALQRDDIDDLLDEEEGELEDDAAEDDDFDDDDDDAEGEEEEDTEDPDSGGYDDSNDIKEGRVRFVENDE